MADMLTHSTVAQWLPARPRDAHKGVFGHLLVLAGSRGMTGAARLACGAACRSGAGLVTLGVPEPLADVMEGALVETMKLPLPATDAASFSRDAVAPALEAAEARDAVVIGPGLSRHPKTVAFARRFILGCDRPLAVDADALYALSWDRPPSGACRAPKLPPPVFTPHPGEMARMTGLSTDEIQDDREAAARHYAEKWNAVVVLKGWHTVIAAPDGRAAVNPTGNQGMATGGAGDVLAGLLGGLLAQGMDPWEAACAAVYVHGLAGDIAVRGTSPRALTAGDLVLGLSDAWRELEG